MAEVLDMSSLPKTESYFKPPHLDKIVSIFRFTGIAHTSRPLRSFKQILLLLYNLVVICLHGGFFIFIAIKTWRSVFGYKMVFVYLKVLCDLASMLFSIYLIVHLVILSRKSHLSRLPKPIYWPSLPKEYEEKTPIVTSVMLWFWFLLILVSTIGAAVYELQSHCYENLLHKNINGTTSDNITPRCLSVALYTIYIPSNFGISVVLIYLAMWINYCTRLFEGINQTLDKMETPFDFKAIKTCKDQYNIISNLVDKINDKYGVFVAYFLFNASVLLFIYGYLLLMTFFMGGSVDMTNTTVLLLIFFGSVVLFLQSFSFENAVSSQQ